MSTNVKLDSIMQKLSNVTQNYPVSQIIAELHVVIERVAFIDADPTTKQADPSQIMYILGRDVSPGMMQFLQDLSDHNSLDVLRGDDGTMFLGYCETFFGRKKQLIFKTAVRLRPEHENAMQAKLMSVFPLSSRIVFEVDPSVVAGFMLVDDGVVTADYSLRSKMVKLLEQYIQERIVA